MRPSVYGTCPSELTNIFPFLVRYLCPYCDRRFIFSLGEKMPKAVGAVYSRIPDLPLKCAHLHSVGLICRNKVFASILKCKYFCPLKNFFLFGREIIEVQVPGTDYRPCKRKSS